MKLFGTDGIRGKAGEYPITPEIAYKLGKWSMSVLAENSAKPVVVIGRDTRISGKELEDALVSGLISSGVRVQILGVLPTPGVSFLVRKLNADAGIMISASHNPYYDNGIKFFNNKGLKLDDIQEKKIEECVFADSSDEHHQNVSHSDDVLNVDDAVSMYAEFAINTFPFKGLSEYTVYLDCAHGAAFEVAPMVFEKLGAKVVTYNNTPDGVNINNGVGALHAEKIAQKVIENSADIGIAFDGDADRLVLVDEHGAILDGDNVLAIAARDMIANNTLQNKTLVVTNYSNLALDEFLKKSGGIVERVENGDKHVIKKMISGGYNLGGENSGHIIFSDINPTGDGLIAALQIISIMKREKKSLSQLAGVLEKFPQVNISIEVSEKKPLEEMRQLQLELQKISKKLGSKGRYLVRYSGTEMKARIMLEGENRSEITKMAQGIAAIISNEVGA